MLLSSLLCPGVICNHTRFAQKHINPATNGLDDWRSIIATTQFSTVARQSSLKQVIVKLQHRYEKPLKKSFYSVTLILTGASLFE